MLVTMMQELQQQSMAKQQQSEALADPIAVTRPIANLLREDLEANGICISRNLLCPVEQVICLSEEDLLIDKLFISHNSCLHEE